MAGIDDGVRAQHEARVRVRLGSRPVTDRHRLPLREVARIRRRRDAGRRRGRGRCGRRGCRHARCRRCRGRARRGCGRAAGRDQRRCASHRCRRAAPRRARRGIGSRTAGVGEPSLDAHDHPADRGSGAEDLPCTRLADGSRDVPVEQDNGAIPPRPARTPEGQGRLTHHVVGRGRRRPLAPAHVTSPDALPHRRVEEVRTPRDHADPGDSITLLDRQEGQGRAGSAVHAHEPGCRAGFHRDPRARGCFGRAGGEGTDRQYGCREHGARQRPHGHPSGATRPPHVSSVVPGSPRRPRMRKVGSGQKSTRVDSSGVSGTVPSGRRPESTRHRSRASMINCGADAPWTK